MDTTGRYLIGVGVLLVLIGVYGWFDHGRTLECRTQAMLNGADTINAVKLCK